MFKHVCNDNLSQSPCPISISMQNKEKNNFVTWWYYNSLYINIKKGLAFCLAGFQEQKLNERKIWQINKEWSYKCFTFTVLYN